MIDREQQPTSWNAGAWFGSQLGSTLWLLVSSALLAARSLSLAILVFALFLVPNLVGFWLWRSRRRIAVFTAFQVFLVVFWVCGMAAILAIDRAGAWRTLSVGGENNIAASSACVMLTVLVAALVVMFRVRQRRLSRG